MFRRALGPLLAMLALASAGTSRNQRLLSHFETNLALEQAFYDSISGTEVCITNRTEKTQTRTAACNENRRHVYPTRYVRYDSLSEKNRLESTFKGSDNNKKMRQVRGGADHVYHPNTDRARTPHRRARQRHVRYTAPHRGGKLTRTWCTIL